MCASECETQLTSQYTHTFPCKPLRPITPQTHERRPALGVRVRSRKALRVVESQPEPANQGRVRRPEDASPMGVALPQGSHVRDPPLRLIWLRHRDGDTTPVRLKPFLGSDAQYERREKAGTNPRLSAPRQPGKMPTSGYFQSSISKTVRHGGHHGAPRDGGEGARAHTGLDLRSTVRWASSPELETGPTMHFVRRKGST